ncbi:DUF4114 domain-containing protein [Spirulina sp. CCNP1310]|uniref:DUF4114 domain-containing protein n=1 Tax=Spirulina sp. CCNP1310 TaxID=3110249 RepID=UPI002B1ED6EA|nr:DUF4114 domain-containing protein [Spirulina sp. CCNP1310]MEA5417781.1 DUF4114 domain-containing protein [Spirulina sp. CCNP1310]
MKSSIVKTLTTSFVVATALLTAGTAQAQTLNLKQDNPALFDTFNSWVNGERLTIPENIVSTIELDPATLRWMSGADPVEIYFINEAAAYRNVFSFSANGGEKQVVFGDVSSTESIKREADGPLALGDGVSLGSFEGDTQLDFFLTPTYKGWTGKTLGTKAADNPLGLPHFIAKSYFDAGTNENWVVIGIEDIAGDKSDRDFNDVVIAVRGIVGTPIEQEKVPEPMTLLGLIGVAALGATKVRRQA